MKKSGTIESAYVVINPASGKNEPILNTLNKVFSKYEVEWDVGITKKFGDAEEFTREASKKDYDVIVGYGGDGTQHELVNGIIGTDKLLGILPGGTGNGFAAGLGISRDTEKALEMLCTTSNVVDVDLVLVNEKYMLSRLYTGIDPELQTSREMKDKYGLFGYIIGTSKQMKNVKPEQYKLTIDGESFEIEATKVYVVNSASTGIHINIGDFTPTDGVLDVFSIDKDPNSLRAAGDRVLHLKTQLSEKNIWHGKKIIIEADNPQSVWSDGEYIGKTPIVAEVKPGLLKVLAEEPKPRHKRSRSN